ncbi:hypothetical protein [Paludibacterium paludis]|uniref:Uncharacterized protein n=1 Tax=Paludibacterium paludis TaxID=1225769 RepID=A0A918P729_9NEIS|nr:hypothetical protein [Paludibacterium paludis]GGY28943.1 hypothetical protein GCM10011289_35150 [Paludibacterium paludis]
MDPIDKTGALRRILRFTAQNPSSAASRARNPHNSADRSASFEQRIALGLANIDPTAPDARDKAFKVFVQAILADQFGAEAGQDPGFAGLVADVADAIRFSSRYDSLAAFIDQQLALHHPQSP